MRTLRHLGNAVLLLGALLGVVAGGVWIADKAGWVQPLVVISGSMEPGIETGSLIISRPTPTTSIEIGDVVSIPSELTGKLVTHRVTSIARNEQDNTWQIHMKGDANAEPDVETYIVGEEVLTPWVRIPQGGKVVSKLMEPAVAMPILLALVALLGLSLLDEPKRQVVRRVIDRVRQRDPLVDELDLELAAVGVDVLRLQDMDDLDLQMYALGIDVPADNGDAATPTPQTAANLDPLWQLTLPASDGIGLVHPPDRAPVTTAGSPPPARDDRTPALSG